MVLRLLLASGSDVRRRLLRNAGLIFEVAAATIDETALRARLLASNNGPQDIAIAVAEAKAEKSSAGAGEALVIGCDQVLSHDGELLGKPETREAARAQLRRLRGDTHELVSAVVIVEDGVPVWRHASEAQMVMRDFSDAAMRGLMRICNATGTAFATRSADTSLKKKARGCFLVSTEITLPFSGCR